jgi:hypothetical protein
MSGSAFAVTHHAFSSGAGTTSDGKWKPRKHLKIPSYTMSKLAALPAFQLHQSRFYWNPFTKTCPYVTKENNYTE